MTTLPPTSRKIWNPDDLDRMRMQSDPIGNGVVHAYGDDAKLSAELMKSLMRLGEPPPETNEVLRGYRDKTRHLPPWADRAKIERAQRFYAEHVISGSVLLAIGSLPQCYLDRLGTPVLVASQQLTEHVFRRLIETAHMVYTVCAPGSLYDDSGTADTIPPGVDKAQTVRLIHSLMRHLLLSGEGPAMGDARSLAEVMWATHWDVERYGIPVNQEDEAFVLLTFSYVTIEGFARLAIPLSDEDKEAILHLWNVVGYVMGVNEQLMAHSYEDAKVLFQLFRARLRGSSEGGRKLTKALVDWINGLLPPFLRWFDAGGELINFINGEEDAALLGVGPTGWESIVHVTVETLLPPVEFVQELRGKPHPFGSLCEYIAKKIIKKVAEQIKKDGRELAWPEEILAIVER